MKAKGEIYWNQLSMWDFSPPNCIEGYRRDGEHMFHYFLKIVDEVIGDCQYRTKVVTELESVPKSLLEEMDEVYVKVGGVKALVYKGEK